MISEFVNGFSARFSGEYTDSRIYLSTVGPRGGTRSLEVFTPVEATKLGCRLLTAAENLGGAEVQPVLVLSTGHLRQRTVDFFEMQTDDVPVCFPKGEYGWWVVVPDHPYGAGHGDGDQDPPTCPEDLVRTLAYARDLGCSWICFDRDGPVRPELPTYNW